MPTPSASLLPLDLASYRHVVVLTGAGISAGSGLSTYRGPGGLWEKAEIARIADARNLPGSLPELWRLYRTRRTQALAATPNAAHQAITDLQTRLVGRGQVAVVTQNVDGLHQRARTSGVWELHGSAFRTRCLRADSRECPSEPFADTSLHETEDVPVCPVCRQATLRPDVVLFGESLLPQTLEAVGDALSTCDLFLSVGTSGQVWPAARFVEVAKTVGARTILVNLDPLPAGVAVHFDEAYYGRAEDVLPALFGVAL
ncbi:MAG: NAD-dependent deacylase [Cytophagales bacterium]|nr:NAD-dependent deacylase [Armatimonadota bacterium]